MVDDTAAEDGDLDVGIEQQQVDRDLRRRNGRVVLGIEVAWVAQLQHPGAPVAAKAHLSEVDGAGRAELVEPRERLLGGPQHRPDEMGAGARRREHVRQQEAIGDLQALLVALEVLALCFDGAAVGTRPGNRSAAVFEQLLDAHGS